MSKHQTNAINTSATSKQVREPTDRELTEVNRPLLVRCGNFGVCRPRSCDDSALQMRMRHGIELFGKDRGNILRTSDQRDLTRGAS
jgi:hypothetical protein